jgi:ankyrin repeat protein
MSQPCSGCRKAVPLCHSLTHSLTLSQVETMKKLLDLGAPMMKEDEQGRTAPYHAAAAGQTEALRLLLERGADVRKRPENGRTAMHAAAATGQVRVAGQRRVPAAARVTAPHSPSQP